MKVRYTCNVGSVQRPRYQVMRLFESEADLDASRRNDCCHLHKEENTHRKRVKLYVPHVSPLGIETLCGIGKEQLDTSDPSILLRT